jgi:hypothetical protein
MAAVHQDQGGVMKTPQSIRLQLMQEVIDLPDNLLPQVFDFIKSLLSQNNSASQNGAYPSGRDPILDLIGLVDDGSLPSTSAEIDELLYGDNPL